eukprot:11268012-Ditylum_brightwellii.AAC.1
MEDNLEVEIRKEEALWAEAEEKERREYYQTLKVEQQKMEEEKRREKQEILKKEQGKHQEE